MTRLLFALALVLSAGFVAGCGLIVWLGAETRPRAPWQEGR